MTDLTAYTVIEHLYDSLATNPAGGSPMDTDAEHIYRLWVQDWDTYGWVGEIAPFKQGELGWECSEVQLLGRFVLLFWKHPTMPNITVRHYWLSITCPMKTFWGRVAVIINEGDEVIDANCHPDFRNYIAY